MIDESSHSSGIMLSLGEFKLLNKPYSVLPIHIVVPKCED